MIKQGKEPPTAFAIDDLYQTTPSGEQIESQAVAPGRTAIYDVLIENDSDETRTFLLRATEKGEPGWTITYLAGDTDITSLITGPSGYTTFTPAPGEFEWITLKMTPVEAALGTTESVIIAAFLDAADETVRDAVRANTTAARLVVNSTADRSDANPGDGLCDTGGKTPRGKPECTLRAALEEANASAGEDTIIFAIPGQDPPTIQPQSALPRSSSRSRTTAATASAPCGKIA